MSINVGDIVRITQHFKQGTNTALMVSFWECGSLTGAPILESQLAQNYHSQYSAILRGFTLHESAQMVKTVVDNLTDGLAYGEYQNILNGGVSGQAAPSYVAISVKQNVLTRATRAGFKRMPFTGEDRINGNEVVIGLADEGKIEDWFGELYTVQNPIDNTVMGTIRPVVIGRVESPPDSGNYVLDLNTVNLVTNAGIIGNTTQNTRKFRA